MNNTKLVKLLGALSTEDATAFGHYLRAFYPKHEVPQRLFEHLLAFHPDYAPKGKRAGQLDRAYIASVVLGLPPDSERRVLNESSKLYRWLLQFLASQELLEESETPTLDLLTLRALKRRQCDKDLEAQLKIAESHLQKAPESTWQSLHELQLRHEACYGLATPKLDPSDDSLQELQRLLVQFCAQAQLRYRCEQLARHSILKTALPPPPVADPMQRLHQLYGLVMDLLSAYDDQSYKQLKQALVSKAFPIVPEEELALFTYLTNYNAKVIKDGDHATYKIAYYELFELYEVLMERNLMAVDGQITAQKFHNAVQVGCEAKKFDWIDRFIEAYANELDEAVRDSVLGLAYGSVSLRKGEPKKALAQLQKVEFKDDGYTFQVKAVQVRCYYELRDDGYYSTLSDYLRAFSVALKRNKAINAKTIAAYHNFLAVIKQLLKAKPEDKQRLLTQLDEYPAGVVYKTWLIEKIEAI